MPNSIISDLKWGLFKWLATLYIKVMYGASSYPFLVDLEFAFKELIFDQYGFFGSIKYLSDYKLKKQVEEEWYSKIDMEYALPIDKQIVLEDKRIVLINGKSTDLRVDEEGWLLNKGRRTNYFFDFFTNTVYFDVITKIGRLEEVDGDDYPWTIVYILPHL